MDEAQTVKIRGLIFSSVLFFCMTYILKPTTSCYPRTLVRVLWPKFFSPAWKKTSVSAGPNDYKIISNLTW